MFLTHTHTHVNIATCVWSCVRVLYELPLMTSLELMRVPTLCPGVCACRCACMCVRVCFSHADLGTHKHHMTPIDKWRMAQSPTPDVTTCVRHREKGTRDRQGKKIHPTDNPLVFLIYTTNFVRPIWFQFNIYVLIFSVHKFNVYLFM